MAKPFSIRDFMGSDARQQDSDSDVHEKVSVYDIGLNPKNEYVMSEIEKIKDSIYALGGVQQNVVLVRCPEGADHKYLALDGHRRLTASRELVAEGYAEFEYVPAVIKGQIDPDMEEAMLVMMNSTQRNKTDYEKVMEHMRLKEIIPKLKKRQGVDGRTRDIEVDMLGVSRGQISIYNTIGTRLNVDLMQLFKNGDIGISLAHAAAQLDAELQQELVHLANAAGGFDEEDIKVLLNRKTIKKQTVDKPEVDENVPESGTSGGEQEETVSIMMENEKDVPESGTFEERLDTAGTLSEDEKNVPESGTFKETVPAAKEIVPPVELITYYANSEDDVDYAVSTIFCRDGFPEDKLTEIINIFQDNEDLSKATTGADKLFRRMFPYKNSEVEVTYNGGYQICYILLGEICKIQTSAFWEGFKRAYERKWKKAETTEPVAVSDAENQHGELKGGYTLDVVDKQIQKYTNWLGMLGENMPRLISEYSCLLDALKLLKEKMLQ